MIEPDVISQTLINDNTAKIIKKLCFFALIFLVLFIVYGIFELANWSIFFSKTYTVKRPTFQYYYYYYKIAPIAAIILLALGFLNAILVYKAYGYMSQSIKTNDSSLMNKGFKIGYQTFYIIFSSIIISLVCAACQLFINLKS